MSYDVLGYDVLGDDIEGSDIDVMGESPFDVQGNASPRTALQRSRWAQQLRRGAPGAPAISEMLLPLGLGSVTFVGGGPTTLTLTAIPQLAFRPERLIVDAFAKLNDQSPLGANSLVNIVDIKVGQRSQLVSPTELPASAFVAQAFGVRLAADPCAPGIVITVTLRYIGPALGDEESITATGVFLGRAAG